MSHVSRVPMRWVDLDAQGHVNNAVVADYLQEARVDWLLSGPQAHLLGTSTMVVAQQVEYLGPVVFELEPIEVELWVGSVGASRFTLGYRVRQAGREPVSYTHLDVYKRQGHCCPGGSRRRPAQRAVR